MYFGGVEPRERIEVLHYRSGFAKCPFEEWVEGLDKAIKSRIRIRIERMKVGYLGSYRFLGQGLYELIIDVGPGYRIYFIHLGKNTALLLTGGDKSNQQRDIKKSHEYISEYGRQK